MRCTKLMSHVANNKVQRKASAVLEIDLNFQKQFHLKDTNESCAASWRESYQEFLSYK